MTYQECLEALKTARTNSHYLAIIHTTLMTGDQLEGAEYDHVCRLSREATPIADQYVSTPSTDVTPWYLSN